MKPSKPTMYSKLTMLMLAMALVGCAALAGRQLTELYGSSEPRPRLVDAGSAAGTFYHDEVKPLVETRCVVCHACYDAPCQLKLSSPAGIDRGASKAVVYDGERLRAANLTRLFEDGHSTQEWRDKGFFPVVNEHEQSPEANLEASVLYKMLALKEAHPLPEQLLLDDSFSLGLARKQVCTTIEEWPKYERKNPLWGMPYGLPGLMPHEFATLEKWLGDGAHTTQKPELEQPYAQRLQRWEKFLNGDSLKQRLMGRYVYEHWFLAHLYFSDLPEREFFRLVRSRTPPGQPIDRIATRRPYDDPGVERVYYRMWREEGAIVAKTHMPYALNDERMKRMQRSFLEADYTVDRLPSYDVEVASNPFIAFEALPVTTRWRFILEESRFTIMNFIKGPVCRGQVALNVINDHFWVFFMTPKDKGEAPGEAFLAQQKEHLRLPAEEGSSAPALLTWLKYSRSQEKFLKAKMDYLNKNASKDRLNLGLVWDGDQSNPNAALTIFRHFDSASVVYGMVGRAPKTAWLVDYSLLERIHYLLVAGFDVYGDLGHQLNTRLYMDFLRMEGEFNFLALLPEEARIRVRDEWYRGASEQTKSFLYGKRTNFHRETGITFKTKDEKTELFGMIRDRLAPVLNPNYDLLDETVPTGQRDAMRRLNSHQGLSASLLPQLVFLTVDSENTSHRYTIIHNNAHSNITSLLAEGRTLLPEEDDLTVVRGFIGTYPGAIWEVDEVELDTLVDRVIGLKSEADYEALMDAWGVRRTQLDFWSKSDELYAAYMLSRHWDAGLFDYNRLENR
jgi:hypothetical protein